MFGGQDENGEYLSEIWVLRAYNGVITKSGDQSWGGYGNGQAQSGSNASGTGVTNTYLTKCATQLSPDVPPSTSTSTSIPSPTSTGNASLISSYSVGIMHKVLAPLSVALVFPAILAYRLFSPSLKSPAESSRSPFSVPILLISGGFIFGLGITGLAISFTSISYHPSLSKRGLSNHYLQTTHGIVGVALAAAFYVVVPVVFFFSLLSRHFRDERNPREQDEAEKLAVRSPDLSTVGLDASPDHLPPSSHSRSQSSTGLLQFWKRSIDRSVDADADEFGTRDPPSPRPSRGFEVVNRPQTAQRTSSHSMSGLLDHGNGRARLGDISWLNRRRMVNTLVCVCRNQCFGVFTRFCMPLG